MYKMDNLPEVEPARISSPTCEDLGIPKNSEDCTFSVLPRIIQNPSLHMEGLRYDAVRMPDPFSPVAMIPLPTPFGLDFGGMEPTFIRKRNERERERVRCVNDGYTRLRQHLPIDNKDKRVSKVETLRAAIQYIKYLEKLLADTDPIHTKRKRTNSVEDTDSSTDSEIQSPKKTNTGETHD